MNADEFLNQRETYSRAFVRSSLRTSDAMKAFEHMWNFSGGDPRTGIDNGKLRLIVLNSAKRHLDAPFEGEFEGVRQQVEDNLLPHLTIDVDGLLQRRTRHRKFQSRSFDR